MGMQFCGPCAPSEAVVAYMEGRLHQEPRFGDKAQECAAKQKRAVLFRQLLLTCDPAMYEWPEYHQRFGFREHLQRMIFIGRTKVLPADKRPESLRRAMDVTYQHLLMTLGPRRFRTGPARRAFKQTYNVWVRENLAEAELLIIGRVVYGQLPENEVPIARRLGVEHLLTDRVLSNELETV